MLIKVGLKHQDIRTSEAFSLTEDEITIKCVQMRFVCGEQIHVEDTDPMEFQNQEQGWFTKACIFSADIMPLLLYIMIHPEK